MQILTPCGIIEVTVDDGSALVRPPALDREQIMSEYVHEAKIYCAKLEAKVIALRLKKEALEAENRQLVEHSMMT